MNQKLLPFALSALALAGSAFAADDAPSVTVYGVMHVSVDALNDDNSTDLAVSSNSSRLGLKGGTSLSDTTKLGFVAEWQVRATGEGENLSRRNQYLSLKQSYGEWKVGRVDTPLKNLRGKTDVFYSDQFGENRTVAAQTGFDSRLDNVIQLDVGTGALHGIFFYSADANIGDLGGGNASVDNNDYDVWSAAGLYDTGNWFVGLGYENRSSDTEEPEAIRAVGGFKFATDHKLNFYFEQARNIDGYDGADRDTFGVSYAWKFGDNTLKAGYYVAGDMDRAFDEFDAPIGGAETGGSVLSLGLDHAYGKNTIAYVTAAFGNSEDNTNLYTVAPGGTGHDGRFDDDEVAAGANTSGVSVGIRHQF